MKSRTPTSICQNGFTLLEIIITIIIAGILGTILIQFLGTALMHSADSVNIVRDEANIEGLIEEIISDYVREINTDPINALATIKATDYGTDVTMDYVQFDAGGNPSVITPGPTNTLRVTIQAGGHTITTLLTNSRTGLVDEPTVTY